MAPTISVDAPTTRADTSVRLRVEVYDVLAAAKGYGTVEAQATWHGMSRAQLFNLRAGRNVPLLTTAMRMAGDLGTTVEALFERRVAA